jgi:hypothetical protein
LEVYADYAFVDHLIIANTSLINWELNQSIVHAIHVTRRVYNILKLQGFLETKPVVPLDFSRTRPSREMST